MAIIEGYSNNLIIDIVTYLGVSKFDNVQVQREVERYNWETKKYENKTIISTLKLNRIYKLKGIK